MPCINKFAHCAALLAAGIVSLSLASCGGGKAAHGETSDAAAHADEHGADAHGDDHAAAEEDGHGKTDSHGGKDAGHGAAKDGGHGKADSHGKSDGHGAAKGGHGKADAHGGGHGGGHGAPAVKKVYQPGEMVEVDLGEFTVTQRQAEHNSILLIHFQIFGVVDHDKREQFEKLLEDRKQRLRDSVITIVQGADADQLSDPGLGWLKSEIVPSVNKLLKSRLLKDVVFSDFAMVQN